MDCCNAARRSALAALLAIFGGCSDELNDESSGVATVAATVDAIVPRDVILLTLDTLRADRLGCYGHPGGLTPNLDRIAREGTRFEHAMAPMPCTAPAHAALFTGLSPRLCGVTSNFTKAPDAIETLAERLRSLGFATGALFNAFDFSAINLVQGFDGIAFDKGRRAERIVAAVAQCLASTAGRRRFTWVHLFIPHGPHDLPEAFATRVTHRYDGPLKDDFFSMEKLRSGEVAVPPDFAAWYSDRYDAAVAFTDARVGELRAAFERAGAWDNALVIVVADHGESLEGRTLGFHAPVIAETTLHVPMLWRGPGIPAGRVVPQLALHLDVVPTLFAQLGETIPGELEGRDLSPLFEADDLAALEWSRHGIATLPTRFEGKASGDSEAAVVRSGRFKLILREGGARALFDLAADPAETSDVSVAHADVVRALESAFESWVRATAEATSGGAVSPEMAAQLRKLGYQ